jgi:hypothetical protein
MPPRFYGIALRKVRHDAAGERFVLIRRDRAGAWRIAAEYGELDGEAAWAALADHGLWSERIALLLDHARERYLPAAAAATPRRNDHPRRF